MVEKVKRYAKKWHMLDEQDRIIVGVSGGADSVCLLFVLSEIRKEIPIDLVVVHVNHGLRGAEADADEAYVKQLCETLAIPFCSYRENIELIAKSRKQSTEEAGREVRRACFADTLERYGGNKIALAHHKNDNAETMLHNLARGTGLKGLGGMKPVQGIYIRPLLCLDRAEIEAFLRERGISYCEDVTNASDDYTRNRIRNHVLPFFEKEVNAAAVDHMGETMAQLQEIQAFLELQTEEAFDGAVRMEEKSCLLLKSQLDALHIAIRKLVIKRALGQMAEAEKDLEQTHVAAVLELFEKQVGRQTDLPYGLQAKRVYEGVKISRRQEEEQTGFCEEIPFRESNFGEIVCDEAVFRYRIFQNGKEIPNWTQKGGKQWFDCDIIQNGLSVRTRRPGDYITIHPDGRTQKLKSFFINEKVPQEERDKILLLADGNHILWIVGMRTNCLYQVNSKTKHVFEIQVDKGVLL